MIVKVYAVNQDTGEEVFQWHSRLSDFEFSTAAEYREIRAEIEKSGRAWIGGGAAQLFLAMRA